MSEFFNPQPKTLPVRLSPHEKAALKNRLYHKRAKGHCETCGKKLKRSENGKYNIWKHAHLHHIKSRGAGGGETPDNVQIICPECHRRIHSGK